MSTEGVVNIGTRTINGIVVNDAKFIPATLEFGAAATWPAGSVLGRLTASGRYARFDAAASNGAQVPSAILTQPVTTTAAANVPFDVLIQGEVRLDDLVNSAGSALTDAQVFLLRDYAIIARDVRQITFRDNNT